jgi:hypothetical protein
MTMTVKFNDIHAYVTIDTEQEPVSIVTPIFMRAITLYVHAMESATMIVPIGGDVTFGFKESDIEAVVDKNAIRIIGYRENDIVLDSSVLGSKEDLAALITEGMHALEEIYRYCIEEANKETA